MLAVEYVKSVPRYLAARWLGPRAKAVYTSRMGVIRLVERPPPALPGGEWVRVRPTLSGICGSDLATVMAKGSAYFSPLTSAPFVLGHEVVGIVEEAGREASDWRPGRRVVLEPPLHCTIRGLSDLCPQCLAGHTSRCENVAAGWHTSRCENVAAGCLAPGIQTGYCRDTGGGWSESLVAHQRQLHAVPDDLPDEVAVLVEPMACAVQSVSSASLKNEDTVAVIGCGSIGTLTILAIRRLGFSCRILAVARHEHQRAMALRMGADQVIGSRDLQSEVTRNLGGKCYQPELGGPVCLGGVHVCFDCVASSRTIDDAIRFTRSGGTVMLVGMPGVPRNIDWTAIWFKELRVIGSYTSSPSTFRRTISQVNSLKEPLSKFVGATFPLTEYKKGLFCAMNTGLSKVMKTALRPEERG